MSTLLNFGQDNQGQNAYAPQFPTDIYTATLINGGASSVTVPQNHSQWIMSISVQPGGEVGPRLPRRSGRVTPRSLRAPAPHGQPRIRAGGLDQEPEAPEREIRDGAPEEFRRAAPPGGHAREPAAVPARLQHDREHQAGECHYVVIVARRSTLASRAR